jgi:hypothetical protein
MSRGSAAAYCSLHLTELGIVSLALAPVLVWQISGSQAAISVRTVARFPANCDHKDLHLSYNGRSHYLPVPM